MQRLIYSVTFLSFVSSASGFRHTVSKLATISKSAAVSQQGLFTTKDRNESVMAEGQDGGNFTSNTSKQTGVLDLKGLSHELSAMLQQQLDKLQHHADREEDGNLDHARSHMKKQGRAIISPSTAFYNRTANTDTAIKAVDEGIIATFAESPIAHACIIFFLVLSCMAYYSVMVEKDGSKCLMDQWVNVLQQLLSEWGILASNSGKVPNPCEAPELIVSLVKTAEEATVGLGLDFVRGDNTLHVTRIDAGLIRIYNDLVNKDKKVEIGDKIVEVNGIRGDSKRMLADIQSQHQLSIVIIRDTQEKMTMVPEKAWVPLPSTAPALTRKGVARTWFPRRMSLEAWLEKEVACLSGHSVHTDSSSDGAPSDGSPSVL